MGYWAHAILSKQQGNASQAPAALATAYFSDTAPSWEQLEVMVRGKMDEFGVDFWAEPDKASGSRMADWDACLVACDGGGDESTHRINPSYYW